MKKCAKYSADILVMFVIFGVVFLYGIDYIISLKFDLPYSPRWGHHHFHLIKDYILECILWFVLFWKSFRLGACKYTWIALISYGVLIASWLSYYIFLFPYKIMQIIECITLIGGMSGMIITYFILRWIGTKSSKT